MQRDLEVRIVPALFEILRAEGVVTKIRHRASGLHRGGIPIARGSLFQLLKNPVYRGRIVHKGKAHDGARTDRRSRYSGGSSGNDAVVGADVWEHTYCLGHHGARPAYAKALLTKLFNWPFAAGNLDGNGFARADQGRRPGQIIAATMSLIATKAKQTELSATP